MRVYRFSSAVDVFNYSFNFRALLTVEEWSTALHKLTKKILQCLCSICEILIERSNVAHSNVAHVFDQIISIA